MVTDSGFWSLSLGMRCGSLGLGFGHWKWCLGHWDRELVTSLGMGWDLVTRNRIYVTWNGI